MLYGIMLPQTVEFILDKKWTHLLKKQKENPAGEIGNRASGFQIIEGKTDSSRKFKNHKWISR